QAAARHMQKPEVQEAGGGRIVNFGSVSGLRGRGELTVYGASKAAVMNMTMSLAQDWAPSGIRVNALAPGQFDTDMGEPVIGEPAKREAFIRRVPLGRVARPEEIGALVVYLCAEASAYVTGSVFPIDGGLTLL
ncbi:MAG: SDR family oxidoreductase, partial [Gemmatimonadota bacterium]